jgi:hypothetical protein
MLTTTIKIVFTVLIMVTAVFTLFSPVIYYNKQDNVLTYFTN